MKLNLEYGFLEDKSLKFNYKKKEETSDLKFNYKVKNNGISIMLSIKKRF